MTPRITHKIAAISMIGVIGLMTVGVLHLWGTAFYDGKVQIAVEVLDTTRVIKEFNDDVLEARRTDKDFLLTNDETYALRHAELSRKIIATIEPLQDRILAGGHFALTNMIERIRRGYIAYNEHFAKVVILQRSLGLNENSGLQGAVRTSARAIEDAIEGLGQPQLMVALLQMRRSEKDFMLQRYTVYRDHLLEKAEGFTFALAATPIPDGIRDEILNRLFAYREDFLNWANTSQALTREMVTAARARDDIEPVVEAMVKEIRSSLVTATDAAATARTNTAMLMTIVIAVITIIGGVAVMLLGRSISKPLTAMTRAMAMLADGTFNIVLPGLGRRDEIGDMAAAVESFKLKAAERALRDPLTGLGNRAFFLEEANSAMQQLRQYGKNFALLLLDLDHFKAINDSFGHPAADQLLRIVAQRICSCLGESDAAIRLGGDEFVVLQRICGEGKDEAVALAGKLLAAINAPCEVDGQIIAVGASIGVAPVRDGDATIEAILADADFALYQAKYDGRNGYCLFGPEMQAELSVRRTLQHDLGDALSRNEFELHYQPMIDMASRRTCGVEALVRWHHPQHGLVSPERFIPLAEEMGKIVALGEWILGEACRQAMRWPPDIKIAVNVSPHQFRSGRLVAAVTRALAESGLPAHRLEIELTESALLRNTAENLESLRQLKNLGVTIVLDDFGTGYSSLTYLRMFSFDKIKIDKAFILELSTSADCAAIVCAITGLARSLDMITTAEGVETQEQYDLLRIAGCSQAQGRLFGGPQPAHELTFPHNQYEIRHDAWMLSEVAWAM